MVIAALLGHEDRHEGLQTLLVLRRMPTSGCMTGRKVWQKPLLCCCPACLPHHKEA